MENSRKDILKHELAEFIEDNYIGIPLMYVLDRSCSDVHEEHMMPRRRPDPCDVDSRKTLATNKTIHPKREKIIETRIEELEDGSLPFDEMYEKDFDDIFKIFNREETAKSEKDPTEEDLRDFLKATDISETFTEYLLRMIQEKGLTEAEVYNSVFMDRRLFNKIRNDVCYQPTKRTALLLSVALKLNLQQTQEFIGLAGFKMTHASKTDLIVEFFIRKGCYDVMVINEMLEEYHMPLLMKCD